MKKVGIMTMHRVENYGSFLQAFSLMKNIENLGYQVEFVDYRPGKALVKKSETDNPGNKKSIISKLRGPHLVNRKLLDNNYELEGAFQRRYQSDTISLLANTKAQMNYDPDIDTLVIGSDEVFNCLQTDEKVGFSKDLFGANTKASKIISYAASFGNTTIEGIEKYGIRDQLKTMLSGFSRLSVRDLNSKSIIENLLDKEPDYNLDPVLIYNFDEYIPASVPVKNYILIYAYGGRIRKEEAREIIKFAKKEKKKIICLCSPQLYFEKYLPIDSPFEVLAYVRNADYVITDTFHGSVFASKYNRPFVTFVRRGNEAVYGNYEKISDLLIRLKLDNHMTENAKDLHRILRINQDFTETNEVIKRETERSIKYLKESL